MDSTTDNTWRKCSSCKNSIAFGSRYYICSVSTCNGQRTGYVFCSVHCFERHLPAARHKDAGAVEMTAPRAGATPAPSVPTPSPGPTTTATTASSATSSPLKPAGPSATDTRAPNRVFATPLAVSKPNSVGAPREVLVIASRLKEYIQARSEYNTSQSVMDVLSDHLRIVCDRAIDNARADGRKTVMDRDFEFLKK